MRLISTTNAHQFAHHSADWLVEKVQRNSHSVMLLPTGRSPMGLYRECVRRVRCAELSLKQVSLFNLDEYSGLSRTDAHSYAAFLHEHLIAPAGIAAGQVRLLRGDAPDPQSECQAYDRSLLERGGVDVCILGLGANGHIAFNEPGVSWGLRTHLAQLSLETRTAHAHQQGAGWLVPTHALTVGIQTIQDSRSILLLVRGAVKAAALRALRSNVADTDWPVTSLVGHSDLTVIELCEPAAHP